MADHAPTDSPIIAGIDPLIGQEVGGAYRIVRIVGSGGMGTVYEARHLRLNRRCAVKVLLHALQDDPTYLERFRREAEVTSRLRNRHICEVLDFNRLPDGSPYLAMEFLEGEDLASRLKRQPPTPAELAPIIEGIGSALAAAHKIGVVHRDIKPANVFVARTAEGEEIAKLLDFGAAKRLGHDANLTATGQVLGSVWYVSPEQARGQELDHRTDIFSLGIVVHEALTGKNPFEAGTPTETLFKIVSDPAPALVGRVAGASVLLDQVLGRALAKRREDRYPSVAEFTEAVVAALDPAYRRGGSGPRPSLAEETAKVAAATTNPMSPRPQSPGSLSTASTALIRKMGEQGLLDAAKVEQALVWEKAEGELIFDRLASSGLVEERALLRFLAGSSGLKYITAETLAKSRLPAPAVAKLPAAVAEARCVAPLAFNPADGLLTVAVPEASAAILEALQRETGASAVQGILALRGTIRAAIRRFYPSESLSVGALAPRSTPSPFPLAALAGLVAPAAAPSLKPPPPVELFATGQVSGTGPTPVPDDELDTFLSPPRRETTTDPARAPHGEEPPDSSVLEPLQAAGLLPGDAAAQARALQRERGGFLGDALLRLGLVKEVDFLRTFAELYGTRFVKSDKVVKVSFDQTLIDQIPARVAEELRVLPFARNPAAQEIHVIAAVPLNPEIAARIAQLTQAKAVTVYLATPGAVQAALRRWYYGDLTVLSEVTPNGAGPGPMRPRSAPGVEPEPERDASQKTVQVALTDDRTNVSAAAPPAPQGERALVELQKRLPLDGDPSRILDALLDVVKLESVALVLEDGRKASRGLRAQTEETVPRARIESAQSTRMAVATDDAGADPLLGATRLVREKGVKAALTLPLLGRARVLGALHIDSSQPLRLHEQKDLAAMSDFIALRLEDAAQLTRARDDARAQLIQDRFLPPALRESARQGTLIVPAEGQLVQATLLRAQLRNLDDLAARLSAAEVVSALNRAWNAVIEVVHAHGGSVVELQGNKLLAMWSPALGTEADAARGMEAALALQHKVATLMVGNRKLGVRIGLHSGLVTLGRMGTADRADFAVVGGAARTVAAVAALALEGQVLASEATLQRAGPQSGLKPIPLKSVQDGGPPVMTYLIGAQAAQELEFGK